MFTIKNVKVIILWLVVFVGMIVIFNLSSQPASQSNQLSKGLTLLLVETLDDIFPSLEISIDRFNHLIRKNAHFLSYLLLSILIWMALWKSGIKGIKSFFAAFFLAVLYAITDEVHQLFVPGRGGQVKDVIIDSFGALTGLVLVYISMSIRRRLAKTH